MMDMTVPYDLLFIYRLFMFIHRQEKKVSPGLTPGSHRSLSVDHPHSGKKEEGGGVNLFVACLSYLTIDHTSPSRRRGMGTERGGTHDFACRSHNLLDLDLTSLQNAGTEHAGPEYKNARFPPDQAHKGEGREGLQESLSVSSLFKSPAMQQPMIRMTHNHMPFGKGNTNTIIPFVVTIIIKLVVPDETSSSTGFIQLFSYLPVYVILQGPMT